MTSEQEKGTLGLVIAFLVMIVTVPGSGSRSHGC